MEQWYLAQYRPGRANLQRVQYQLAMKNIPSWTPQMIVASTAPDDHKPHRVEALFPGYIFIEFDVDKHHPSSLSSLPGMADFVRTGVDFRPIPSSVLDDLMSYPLGLNVNPMNFALNRSLRLTRRQKQEIKRIVTTEDPVARSSMFLAFTDALGVTQAAA